MDEPNSSGHVNITEKEDENMAKSLRLKNLILAGVVGQARQVL